ncbi:MAG: NuoF [Oscillospiraceae bacterium]|nr:NuoF [Oscillospiraceae bacterium]
MIRICETTAEGLPEAEAILNKPAEVCPVQWASEVAHAAYESTCGRGTMCRDGMHQMFLIIDDITGDKGTIEDLDLLQKLCDVIITANDCEKSQKAAQLVKDSLTNHYDDWSAHLLRKRCKAGVCAAFPKPVVPAAASEDGATRRRRRG